MKRYHLVGLFFFLITILAPAQNIFFQKKEFIYKGDTLLYRVLLPFNYNKSVAYPMVIFLHGPGECGNDNEKQLIHGSSLFTDSLNRANYPAIIVFPQCPENASWVTLKDLPNDKFDIIDTRRPTKPLYLVKKLIDTYKSEGLIDSKRIYIGGLSLGGMGTLDLICRYPKTFAAAISICGAVNVERLKKVRKMPIRIYYGSDDNVVSPEYARNAYVELKAEGSQKVEIISFPGVGHDSWTSAFAQPDFLTWLFNQHK